MRQTEKVDCEEDKANWKGHKKGGCEYVGHGDLEKIQIEIDIQMKLRLAAGPLSVPAVPSPWNAVPADLSLVLSFMSLSP